LDKLWSQCEGCICTSFKKKIDPEIEAEWNLVDYSQDSVNPFIGMQLYVLNIWNMCGILANLLLNQVRKTVARVIYDRELFNYEEYQSRGLSNDKTIVKLIFARGGTSK